MAEIYLTKFTKPCKMKKINKGATKMVKTTKTKTFDTNTATLVKKVTFGSYGDPAGYETTMYQTPEGDYFLYTNGGADSPYPKEAITSVTKSKAIEWLKNN